MRCSICYNRITPAESYMGLSWCMPCNADMEHQGSASLAPDGDDNRPAPVYVYDYARGRKVRL